MPAGPILIHDVDGCLYDWLAAFKAWARPWMADGAPPQLSYSMREMFPEGTDVLGLIQEFNEGPHFAHLPEKPGGAEAIEEMRRRMPRMRHVAVTSVGRHPVTMHHREQQIRRCGIDQFEILGLHDCKIPHFRKHGPQALVIEDSPSGLAKAVSLGLQAICFDEPYNQDWRGPRVKSWAEVPDLVEELMKVAA